MTAPGRLVLRLTRILPAPRAAVYRALSDPGELARWWGPEVSQPERALTSGIDFGQMPNTLVLDDRRNITRGEHHG
jgi:hypothetical protein